MTQADVLEAFTNEEVHDIEAAALERGRTLQEIMHDAVMADLAR